MYHGHASTNLLLHITWPLPTIPTKGIGGWTREPHHDITSENHADQERNHSKTGIFTSWWVLTVGTTPWDFNPPTTTATKVILRQRRNCPQRRPSLQNLPPTMKHPVVHVVTHRKRWAGGTTGRSLWACPRAGQRTRHLGSPAERVDTSNQ